MDDQIGDRRSRRSNPRKSGARQKALERIKKHRETGEKIEYEVEEEDDLYELVDEDKYAQIVQERQEDNFIVDDDGAGYADHGRELFDEDPNEEPPPEALKEKNRKDAKHVKSAKITSLFNNATVKKKKKENNVTNEGDADLDEILNSIKSTKSSTENKMKSKKTDTKTPKRLNKHPPRRLEESGKRIMLKTKSNAFAIRKSTDNELRLKEDIKHEEDEMNDDDIGVNSDDQAVNYEPIDDNDIEHVDDSQESGVYSHHSVKEENDDLMEDDFNLDNDEELKLADTEKAKVVAEVEELDEELDIDNIFDKHVEEEPLPNIDLSSAGLPTQKVEGIDVLRFFWIDAFEDRYNQPGTVFLFGKVWVESSKCYVSCCVSVKNIQRQMYILPWDTKHDKNGKDLGTKVSFKDVYDEFNDDITTKYGIKEFKCKQVEKSYSFEKEGIPNTTKYLEVLYSANQPQLPMDLKGETIKHIFGTNTSSLELLFLNQKLHGPCWIDIKYPQVVKHPMSWCKVEAFVDRPSFVTVVNTNDPPPPLTVLSLSMLTMSHHKNHSHEVICLCGLVHRNIHLDKGAPSQHFQQNFCFVTKPSENLLPFDFTPTIQKTGANINVSTNERSMLGLFLARIQTIDPDVIVGHDVHGFDMDVLLHRFAANKVPHWSKISRLRRTQLPKSINSSKHSNMSEKFVTCGRLVCDIKISCKELIRCKSYDLTELASVVLNKSREEILPEDVPKRFMRTKSLMNMIQSTRMDAMLNLQIMYELNVLPLAYQITGICGNTMSRTLLGGRSERNEFLLLHAFSKKNYILPDKVYGNKKTTQARSDDQSGEMDETTMTQKKSQGRKKPAYTGGLVLEPKKGFYDKYILLLDFNSLYPSIIQEYNICFTTMSLQSTQNHKDDDMPDIPNPGQEPGILPTEIRMLVERRKQVKKLLKTVAVGSDMYMQYDIRQKALKLTANSMYGCLGFSHSRFYAKPLAALVTGKGREILMKTKDLASNLSLDVIYGDTDSIMINTNTQDLKEVRKIGNKVKNEVNKLYKMVEIDIDGIFKSMLLLKKKKYAAILVDVKDDGTTTERIEMKGLDIVRRDWCDLAKDAGTYVLNELLSANQRDKILENIHDFLTNLKELLESGKVEPEKFEIHKSLTKNPDEYPDKKALPHVTVALRLMSQGRRVAVGDTISYVICEDSSNLPSSQRAYHPDEVIKNNNLKIDLKYYLASQVHPVVSRLCDPIEGMDAAHIAECLGLDSSQYKTHHNNHHHDNTDATLTVLMSEEERFKDVDKFPVQCFNPTCDSYRQTVEFKGSFEEKEDILVCAKCKKQYDVNRMINALYLFIREKISKYYKCWLSCDDPVCGHVTRHISVKSFKSQHQCQQCRKGYLQPEYTDAKLYNQLYYLVRLFDVKHSRHDGMTKSEMSRLHKIANNALSNNAYSTISFKSLFS